MLVDRRGVILLGSPDRAGVIRSRDGGVHWEDAGDGITDTYVEALAIDSSGVLYAGTSGHGIFRSTNGGNAWLYSGGDNVDAAGIATTRRGGVLVGGWLSGLLYSPDGSPPWSLLAAGTPSPYVMSVAISPDGRGYAAFQYDGLYRTAQPIMRVSPEPVIASCDLHAWPNPVGRYAQIEFFASRGGFADLEVVDSRGIVVRTLVHAHITGGAHQVSFNSGELSNGWYRCRLRTHDSISAIDLMVFR